MPTTTKFVAIVARASPVVLYVVLAATLPTLASANMALATVKVSPTMPRVALVTTRVPR